MNRIVFITTFMVMILLTPFIFNKLMNSKFDEMLNNFKSQGIEIKEIKNKSSYILTDRIFEVKIPGKFFNLRKVKNLELEIETKFKNLPVTDVKFIGELKKIILPKQELNLSIKFLVITPDFKSYRYKIFANKIGKISFTNINGVLKYPYKNNLLSKEINITNIAIKNFKSFYQKDKNSIILNNECNISTKIDGHKLDIIKLKTNTQTIMKKTLDINSVLKAESIKFANLDVNKPSLKIAIKNLVPNSDIEKVLENGLKAYLNLDFPKVGKYGFLKINANIEIKKDDKLFEKLSHKNYEDINLEFNLSTTPKIGIVLIGINPLFAFMLEESNKTIKTNIKIKKGKIFVNGKELKSH